MNSCDTLSCLKGSVVNYWDSTCSVNKKSLVSWCSEAGVEYLLFVGSNAGSIGSGKLTIELGDPECVGL